MAHANTQILASLSALTTLSKLPLNNLPPTPAGVKRKQTLPTWLCVKTIIISLPRLQCFAQCECSAHCGAGL